MRVRLIKWGERMSQQEARSSVPRVTFRADNDGLALRFITGAEAARGRIAADDERVSDPGFVV
jgi:hypothetical protein